MSALDSLKDPRSIASVAALVAVGVSWTYFQGEITSLKEEVEEIKKHIQAYIRANPASSDQLDHIRQAVKILDSRINKQQEEMRAISEKSLPEAPPVKRYQRLTERSTRQAPREHQLYDDQSDLDDDLASEIAAMS